MKVAGLPERTTLAEVTHAVEARLVEAEAARSELPELLPHLQRAPQRNRSRIAIKLKGRILFIDPAEVVAVQAEGNYVSLQQEACSYLIRESISAIAEKLKPYGFIRIHRSVLVNVAFVEEIRPEFTGEYALRVKGGQEYTVTRTYKKNLKSLAELWISDAEFESNHSDLH